jgi:hypothetical protein
MRIKSFFIWIQIYAQLYQSTLLHISTHRKKTLRHKQLIRGGKIKNPALL